MDTTTKSDFNLLREYFKDAIAGEHAGDPKRMLAIVDSLDGYMDYLINRGKRLAAAGVKDSEYSMDEIREMHNQLSEISKEIAEIKDLHDELNRLAAENAELRSENGSLREQLAHRLGDGWPYILPINPPKTRDYPPWWVNQPTCSIPGMYHSETTTTHHPTEEKPEDE